MPAYVVEISAILTAIATIAIAIVAVFGAAFSDWIRATFASPKLTLEHCNLDGQWHSHRDGERFLYFHLSVKNNRSWAPARNCQVLLFQIERRTGTNKWQRVPFSVPLQFVWTPRHWAPALPTVTTERILDFGLISRDTGFLPATYDLVTDFPGIVRANEACRYHLRIMADNYAEDRQFVFEVAWDGQWSTDVEEMKTHLKVESVDEHSTEVRSLRA